MVVYTMALDIKKKQNYNTQSSAKANPKPSRTYENSFPTYVMKG